MNRVRYFVEIPEGHDESYALDGITMGEIPGTSSKFIAEEIVSHRWLSAKAAMRQLEADRAEAKKDKELLES